jgi:hypothetical protein
MGPIVMVCIIVVISSSSSSPSSSSSSIVLWDTTATIIITTSDYGNPYSTGSIVRDGLSGFEHTLSDATHDDS